MASFTADRLPTGRPGQMLAVLLVVLVAALAWSAAGAPLFAWHAERADALERRAILARRMAEVAADLPRLQQQAADARTGPNGGPGVGPAPIALFEGGSDAVAGAALQQKLQELATSAGTTVSSTESLPPVQLGAYRLIAVRVAVNTPWQNLVHLLQRIDEASPQMLVDDLQVHGSAGFIRDGGAPLDTSLVVMGFRSGTSPQ